VGPFSQRSLTSAYLQLLGEHRGAAAVDRATEVAVWAAALAEEVGWPRAEVSRLREAALLHEIGTVLIGPEQLHGELGAIMLGEAVDGEQSAWIRRQDERWDGAGAGELRGEEIPEGARLLSIAAVWVDERVHRGDVAAITRCWAEAGRRLWPVGVKALTRLRHD
jgi:response regulator RpfG family c-di-GMP phosphodiesterase